LAEIEMRGMLLAVVAIQIAHACPASAEGAPANQPITEVLPLYEKNRCSSFKDPADQLFCGDPELNAIAARLSTAIQERLNRIANRPLAIAENAEWIRNRDSSCGISGPESISPHKVKPIQRCLLKETEERIEILDDPNFDCLATNTTAGMLICSDPALAIAKAELNEHVLALVAKLKGDDARDALSEYERWSRERDRKCGLVGKDNVPLEELSSSTECLARDISERTVRIIAANGDPKTIFGRRQVSPLPDADAVDLCVTQIHSANACQNFLTVSEVLQIDDESTAQEALVTAAVEMIVLSPFVVCSPIASSCTGTCWDPKTGKPNPAPGSRDAFAVAHRVQIGKTFTFQKTAGGWRCDTNSLHPVDFGLATSGP
jgi:uncharacterized protein YecT (DUF1311 family)